MTAPTAAPAHLRFLVTADAWVAGRRRRKGEVVELTAAQARYERAIERRDLEPRPEAGGEQPQPDAGGDQAAPGRARRARPAAASEPAL